MYIQTEMLRNRILSEFQTLAFARDSFPMLTDWGVEDFSLTLHSLGCNYLCALGRHLGFWATSEYPVKIVEDGSIEAVRPDVIWWSKDNSQTILVGEFERFDAGQAYKLFNKAKHLLHVHQALERAPQILVLMTWAIAGTDLSFLQKVRSVGHDGFRTSSGIVVPGLGNNSAFLVASAIFGRLKGLLKLQRIIA